MPAISVASTGDDPGCGSRVRVSREAIKPKITTRLASGADVEAYFGKPPEVTMRAYVALVDDKVCGVVGVAREGNIGKFFADFNEKLAPYLASPAVMRVVKKSLGFCDAYRGPVISIAEHAEGCRILFRLGFTHLEGEYYAWLK